MDPATHPELRAAVSIIPSRLSFVQLTRHIADTATTHCFTIDDMLRYEPFFQDFGPLNLGCVYRFVEMLKGKLEVNTERATHTQSNEQCGETYMQLLKRLVCAISITHYHLLLYLSCSRACYLTES